MKFSTSSARVLSKEPSLNFSAWPSPTSKCARADLAFLLCGGNENFRRVDANDLAARHGRLDRQSKRTRPGTYVKHAIAVLHARERDVAGSQQAAPPAHETLVAGAHREHLCLISNPPRTLPSDGQTLWYLRIME